MAGYKDSGRTYVGVFGVSYMLKMALKSARETKFLLVVDDNKMQIEQVEQLVVTFHNFILMLKTQYLINNENVAEKLFNSVSIVVTKATEDPKFYLGTLKLIIKYLDSLEDGSHLNTLTNKLLKSILKH